VRTNRID
jgi:hypothetical protein